jgi:aminotransferase
MELLEVTGAHFVFDEVYDRITYTDRFCSILQLDLPDAVRKRISYVNSFSKSFAMTGWRLGYAFVPDWLLESVLKVSQVTMTNATTFVQSAAVSAIVNRQTHQSIFNSMHALYATRFRELGAILHERGQEFVVPEGAFYYFIRCGQDADRFAMSILESERIAVVPGSAYGKYYKDFYRVSFAVDDDSYAGFLNWLQK